MIMNADKIKAMVSDLNYQYSNLVEASVEEAIDGQPDPECDTMFAEIQTLVKLIYKELEA
jgi:hypothetical protein